MAQARRASDECAFMLLGEVIGHRRIEDLFLVPQDVRTAAYIEGRYGEPLSCSRRLFDSRRAPAHTKLPYALGMTDSGTGRDEPHVGGEIVIYRLFDVGYAIALDRALDLLATSGPDRRRPTRSEAVAIQIPNPPIAVSLGTARLDVQGQSVHADVSARVFDFGVVSMRARIAVGPDLPWSAFADWGTAVHAAPWSDPLADARDRLLSRIAPAVDQPDLSAITEDYTVFQLDRLVDASGGVFPLADVHDDAIARLLLGESKPLSAGSRKALISPRLSYFEDDLVVLTWSTALVVEPTASDTDVQYVLEFANAQLLELRWYDAVLDAELPAIQSRFRQARRSFRLLGRRYSHLLQLLQHRMADSVELIERVENSLQVTDDVYLARVHSGALAEFRERAWRDGIDRKIAIVRGTYDMLNAESLARRSETLEVIVVLLIMFEIVLSLLHVPR